MAAWPSSIRRETGGAARIRAAAPHALLEPFCDRAEGLAHAARGRTRAARESLNRALVGFERMGTAFEAARTRGAAETVGR